MSVLMTLVNEIKDTKQKVKDMQKKYNEISHNLHVPQPVNGYEYVLVKKEKPLDEVISFSETPSPNVAPALQSSQDVVQNLTDSYQNPFSPEYRLSSSVPSSPNPMPPSPSPATTPATIPAPATTTKPQQLLITPLQPESSISERGLTIDIDQTNSLLQSLESQQNLLEHLLYSSDNHNSYFDAPEFQDPFPPLDFLSSSSNSNIESLADELGRLNRNSSSDSNDG